jgi:hypothetical protein
MLNIKHVQTEEGFMQNHSWIKFGVIVGGMITIKWVLIPSIGI